MAGASMKSIKLRIHSMQNTRQITKAMEMVAASKMNKAQEKALRTRPYYTTLHSTLSGIAAATRDFSSPYLQKREEKRVCCVAIAGDRGLAGGYNSNVLRLAAETLTGEENCVVPIGKKAGEYFRHRGAEILTEDWLTAENLSVGGCFTLARHLAGLYRSGQVDAIELAEKMRELGVNTIIYTDIMRDGTLSGPNVENTRKMVKNTWINVIASGGVKSIEDIVAVRDSGACGVIVGTSIYEGTIDFKEALKARK